MSRRKNDLDLTPDEIAFLERSAPIEIREYVAETKRDTGARIMAYRKVAAAARAEREALIEIRVLQLAQMTGNPTRELAKLQAEHASLVNENEGLKQRVAALAAIPAMAIHSGPEK